MTSEREPAYIREHGPLEAPLRILRLDDQIAEVQQEPAWQHGERAGRTLVKEGGLSAVLTVMRAGTDLPEHHTEGPVTIHCLSGRIELSAGGRSAEIGPGELAALDSDVRHSLKALTDSAFLITLAR
jgi:quercetin dioxygenase-like cupin family protein